MIRVRICTNRCRCHSSCRRSRFSGSGTQIRGKLSSRISLSRSRASSRSAFFVEETGECGERRLSHDNGEAERFYRDLKQRGISMRVGMEATGYSRWFERLLAELGFEVWIGDPAEIRTRRAKKQKTDSKDAQLLLKLMLEDRFPQIWVPTPENRDLRQLLWHRHRLVQMRTRIMNQLQALAMNENKCWKKKLWSERGRAELERLSLALWASRRRRDLLELLDRMNATIEELTAAVEEE